MDLAHGMALEANNDFTIIWEGTGNVKGERES
jgi:hypothetical protein